MGCIWSNDDRADRDWTLRNRQPDASQIKPLYGEYRCTCGRRWASRLSWRNMYQVCRRCRRHVFAHAQRALRPSDSSRNRNINLNEHPQEYCQMCQRLGQYCGNIRNLR